MKYDISFVKTVLSNKINILSLEYIGSGNHCDAFCINNNLVIKMPKNEKASKCLLTEINILQYLNEKITINFSFSSPRFRVRILYVCLRSYGRRNHRRNFS